jgi:hypothetical protein
MEAVAPRQPAASAYRCLVLALCEGVPTLVVLNMAMVAVVSAVADAPAWDISNNSTWT